MVIRVKDISGKSSFIRFASDHVFSSGVNGLLITDKQGRPNRAREFVLVTPIFIHRERNDVGHRVNVLAFQKIFYHHNNFLLPVISTLVVFYHPNMSLNFNRQTVRAMIKLTHILSPEKDNDFGDGNLRGHGGMVSDILPKFVINIFQRIILPLTNF